MNGVPEADHAHLVNNNNLTYDKIVLKNFIRT